MLGGQFSKCKCLGGKCRRISLMFSQLVLVPSQSFKAATLDKDFHLVSTLICGNIIFGMWKQLRFGSLNILIWLTDKR